MLNEDEKVVGGQEKRFIHIGHLCIYFISLLTYCIRLKDNCYILHNRHKYLIYLRKLRKVTNENEQKYIHKKGAHLIGEATEMESMRFYSDIKRAPSILIDIIIDHILLLYFCIKIVSMFNETFENVEKIAGALAIICLWTNTFLKLQITKKLGPFVIFMKYVPKDLWSVCLMFVFLFAPAWLVFYKTIFMKQGAIEGEEEVEEAVNDTISRQRRAAKGGSGGGAEGIGQIQGFHITFFTVLRMVLVDYEYDDGELQQPTESLNQGSVFPGSVG